MKSEEYIESIYGCLERIEDKINRLSIPQSANGKSEVNNVVSESSLLEVKQDLDTVKNGIQTSHGNPCHDQSRYREHIET